MNNLGKNLSNDVLISKLILSKKNISLEAFVLLYTQDRLRKKHFFENRLTSSFYISSFSVDCTNITIFCGLSENMIGKKVFFDFKDIYIDFSKYLTISNISKKLIPEFLLPLILIPFGLIKETNNLDWVLEHGFHIS